MLRSLVGSEMCIRDSSSSMVNCMLVCMGVFGVGLVMANMYMEHLEETALRTAPLQPTLWIRYVDDTFVIWPHGHDELRRFHEHINQQHPNIQFTIEEEKDGKLAFLDVQVTRSSDGLSTSVYRKPTHTDRYIPFHSHHHQRTTTGAVSYTHLTLPTKA